MSIKYREGHNFLKFYGTQTLKQALIDKNLIGPANIDEYFAMFLQGYVDEYDEKTDVFGEKNIQEVLEETKRKIDDYDNYNIKYAISQLYGFSPPRPYKVYKLYKDMKEHTSNLNLTVPLESKDTFINNLRIIENSVKSIDAIIDKIVILNIQNIEDIKGQVSENITFFNKNIRPAQGDSKSEYLQKKSEMNSLKNDLETLLNKFVDILNTYKNYSIDLFITVHQTFYRYLDEYFGNKEWSTDSHPDGIWEKHPNYRRYYIAQSYVNYVEHIGNSINQEFLNIKNHTNTTSAGTHFKNYYQISKNDIDRINEKVLFYLELEEQIRKIIKIYKKLIGQDYSKDIYDTSHKRDTIDESYNDITIKNVIGINIKSILRLLSSDQFSDLEKVLNSSIETKKIFKAYRHLLKNIVNSDGVTVLDNDKESMKYYKDIFIENVTKEEESYTEYIERY